MREYPGLTPPLIDNLTFDQVDIFLNTIAKYREEIPRTEATLATLVKAFTGGGSEGSKVKHDVKDVKLMPKYQMTKEELDAFFKEGMPSPMSKWLRNYRKKHAR